MGAALDGRWRCLEPDCTEHGEGSMAAVNKASEQHGKAGHSTVTWAVLTLPIEVGR